MWPFARGAPGISDEQDVNMVSRASENEVFLHIYDLGDGGQIKGINAVLSVVGTGAYHAGVEVHGKEWSFGYTHVSTGVYEIKPKCHTMHTYRQSLNQGGTKLSKREVDALIKSLSKVWPGQAYDLCRRNCCHFCEEFCQRLGVKSLPMWLTSLAFAGVVAQSSVRLAAEGAMAAPGAILYGVSAVVKAPGAVAYALLGGGASVEYSVGSIVEVYSRTYKVWCPAVVEKVLDDGQVLTVTLEMPAGAAGESNNGSLFATKTLTKNHPDLRPYSAAAAEQSAPQDEVAFYKPNVGEAVQVYSSTRNAWSVGIVKACVMDFVDVEFMAMSSSGHSTRCEKRLPLGHKHLQRLDISHQQLQSVAQTEPLSEAELEETERAAGVYGIRAWSDEEWSCYSREFFSLLESEGVDERLASNIVRNRLVRSGIPKAMLEQIMEVARRRVVGTLGRSHNCSADSVSLGEFCVACRLIGHCQGILSSGLMWQVEILNNGLDRMLEGDFATFPPAKLIKLM